MQRLVTYRQQAAAGCVMAMLSGCGGHPAHNPKNNPPDPVTVNEGPGCKHWHFPDVTADATAASPLFQLAAFVRDPGGGCDSDQCGLNGMWFGEGVGFREIHVGGAPNQEGLRLTGVMAPPRSPAVGRDLGLAIEKDALFLKERSTGAVAVATRDLAGAKLVLTWDGRYVDKLKQIPITFTLEILEVTRPVFWDCSTRGAGCDRGWKYRFAAITNADDGCNVEVCNPSLARDPADPDASIAGTAVAFTGDVYGKRVDTDPDAFKVYSGEASGRCTADRVRPEDGDIINFACTGTTLSKLYLMRHTTASRPAARPVPVSQRQAMLRMLTADYCGIGQPFTHNGVPLAFGARGWHGFARYDLDASQPIEGIWTDHGAACIGTPRLAAEHPYDGIITHCATRPPRCGDLRPDPRLLTEPSPPPSTGCDDASGNYLVSANPR